MTTPANRSLAVKLYRALGGRDTTPITRSELPGKKARAQFDRFARTSFGATADSLKFGHNTFEVVSGAKEQTSVHDFYSSTGKYIGEVFDSD